MGRHLYKSICLPVTEIWVGEAGGGEGYADDFFSIWSKGSMFSGSLLKA